jgi:hypothetical protein
MVSIRWGHGPAEMAIQRWGQMPNSLPHMSAGQDPNYEWAHIEVCGLDHGRSLLRHGLGLEQAQALRQLLTGEAEADVWRLSDHQVIDRVAYKLAQSRWILFKLVLTAAARAKYVWRNTPGQHAIRDQAASTVHVKARQADAPPRQLAAAAVESDFESVDQDAQAATLRLAAVNGVPFCAVCERARLAREARLAAA